MADSRTRPEAIVIGAGPAGAVAAMALARSGRRTMLVERSRFPRSKVCGGCLAPAGVEAVRSVGLGDALDSIDPLPLDHLHLHAGGATASFDIKQYLSIERGRMDLAFAEAAIDAGVEFVPECRARVEMDDAVTLDHPGGRALHRPGLVVVADGLSGNALANRTDFSWEVDETSPMGLGAIVPTRPPGTLDEGITMRCARAGYVGSSRLSDGRWVVAAAVAPEAIRTDGAGGAVHSVLRETGVADRFDSSIRWNAVGHLTRRRSARGRGRVLLVGDAAGYVEPLTGEGMSWGICRAAALAPYADRLDAGEDVTPAWSDAAERMLRSRRLICRTICGLARRPRLLGMGLRLSARLPFTGWASQQLCWSQP
ncbi:MAG: FAD-dependent monooxygenase [Planctomycetota bacterium]|nr:FAD-dependent monooxygenase [Planctomycetota bacterium]